MAQKTAADVTAKWLRNIQAASQEMQAGVQAVTVSPGQAAANKKQKWVNSLMDTQTQDKWARNVQAVTLGQWQQAMIQYGINRVAQGAQEKQGKTEAAFNALLPFIYNVQQQVKGMDDSTPAAREQRALANMRLMRNYRRPSGG